MKAASWFTARLNPRYYWPGYLVGGILAGVIVALEWRWLG